MMRRNHTFQLRELRAKTDRELARLIGNQLERGFALADENSPDARRLAGQAARDACAWMPMVAVADQRELAWKLAELERRLETDELRVQTACG